ncbi:MAG TPA: zinc ribbon domain-containing protein [Nitrososphaeraceae archaeon]|nr:zinc ribbon domain-containing protein [Nitrososphaeraceae archaeon]HJY15076.1 zinc ribbon domain-containing protein [Nitrososphaeraceae archaeon]
MSRFNGRSAVEEYISTHPLSFSTPDLILKNFVMWLCEPVDDPKGNDEEKIPRVMLYTEGVREQDFAGSTNHSENGKEQLQEQLQDPLFRSRDTNIEPSTFKKGARFCIECGSTLKSDSKFCTKCGTKQESV